MTAETQTNDDETEFTEIDPLKQNVTDKPKRTFGESVCNACRSLTVEPSIVLFMVPCIITMMSTTNLNLEKACRVNLNFTREICDALKARETEGLKEYEVAVQKLTAKAISWKTMLTSTFPCILALFVGSWSDRTGHRKLFIIIPIFGQMLVALNNMMNYYYFYELPLEVLVFSEAVIEALTGSWCFCIMSVFSYISAITSLQDRTFRLGMVNFALTVAFPIGLGISGFMVKSGYYVSYGTAGCLQTINFIYNVFFLKNPRRTPAQMTHDGKGVCHFLRTFFDFGNVKQTFAVLVVNAPRKILLLLTTCLLFGSLHGEMSIIYLLTRYRYNWDEVKFSIFQTYNFITHTLGTIFAITVFSKRLQWHDSLLGIISSFSKICSSFVNFFAYSEFIFFIAPLVEILNGTSLLATRSMMTKLVEPDEFGRVNSLFSLSENLMPLIFIPIYTRTYSASIELMPGLVFLLGVVILLPALLSFCWLFFDHRKQSQRTKKQDKEVESTNT